MQVVLAFASPQGVWQQKMTLPAGATASEALAASEFASRFPEYTDHPLAMGVYGERCDPARVLRDGDRLELYRPLVFDPLESRRRRAAHRKLRPDRRPGRARDAGPGSGPSGHPA